MKILTFTTLFPNRVRPNHGIFVENRLRHLRADGEVDGRVLAPVPWFPFVANRFGAYADFARVPRRETRFGVEVDHPRYPLIPQVGMTLAPWLLYQAMKPVVARLIESGFDFDLIDAHYFYPDGVAAVMLAERYGKPVVVTGRGSDLHLIPRFRLPRAMIRRAAQRASAVITVSQALKTRLVELGAAPARIHVLPNGVDLQRFRPTDRSRARQDLGVGPPVVLSAASLVPAKGHDIAIRALERLPDWTLVIAGDGSERARLGALEKSLGLESRVRFLGSVAHQEMVKIYNAADALVLASEREGWPNVLLESLACGTPVVASAVWGIPEIVTDPAAGSLVATRRPADFADALECLRHHGPDRRSTRAYAERFDWAQTTRGQLALFRRILEHRR